MLLSDVQYWEKIHKIAQVAEVVYITHKRRIRKRLLDAALFK
jgi:hypothetical protein